MFYSTDKKLCRSTAGGEAKIAAENGHHKNSVSDMRKLIKELKNEAKTILLASHNQIDIDELCDTVCEMEAGVTTLIR